MKKRLIISLLVAAMGMIAFVSCEKEEETGNTVVIDSQTTDSTLINTQTTDTANPQSVIHNTELSYTGCHSNQKKGYYDPIISTSYENNTLLLTIENLRVDCGLDSLSVVSEIEAQTIKVNIRQICEIQADCTCPIDVNYSIDNIKPGIYELIIFKSSLTIYQEEITCE